MSNLSPIAITVAVALNVIPPIASSNITAADANYRTFNYTGTAGDIVEIWSSLDGIRFAPVRLPNGPIAQLTGAQDSITVNDRGLFYGTVRRAGTTAGVLTVTGATFASGSASGSSGAGVFVYREGEPTPTGNVFATLAGALAAAVAIPGSTVLVDASLGQPVSQAQAYDWSNTILSGILGLGATLNCINGTTFTNLHRVSALEIVHLGAAPLITTPAGFYALSLEFVSGLTTDAAAGSAMISVSAASTFSMAMGSQCFLQTGGAQAVVSAIVGSSTTIFLEGGSVGSNTVTGAGAILIDTLPASSINTTQGGAADLTFSNEANQLMLFFEADALVDLTVNQIIPPGGRAATLVASGGPQPAVLLSKAGQLQTVRAEFTGDVLNVAGQTATILLTLNGVTIGTIAGIATTAGVKTGSATISPGSYVAGEEVQARVQLSAALTASLTNIKVSAS